MGSESWAETWGELGWLKGFAVISANIRFRGFRFQLLTAGLGWIHFQGVSWGAQPHLGAGKGRLVLLHFICVGISKRENTENSLLEVVPVAALDLSWLTLIILSSLDSHNFQVWSGPPKVLESLCGTCWCGQRKGGWMLEFPSCITGFCRVKQQWFNCLFK